MRIRFARSARKHGVSRSRIVFLLAHCGLQFEQEGPSNSPVERSTRLIYLGDDDAGMPLEVMAVELAGGDILVIHAMPLRAKYRAQYEEAKRWRS